MGSAIRVTWFPARTMRWLLLSRAASTSLFSLEACFQISTSQPPRITATRKLERRLWAALEWLYTPPLNMAVASFPIPELIIAFPPGWSLMNEEIS